MPRQHLTDSSPSELMAATLATTPKERAFDKFGRPLIIPSEIFDLYGAPHRVIAAVGNSMALLAERVTPLDAGSVAQHEIIQYIADEAKALADRIEAKANAFGQQFPG